MIYVFHVLVAIGIGLPRPLGHKSQAYQAIAHLYVGGAIVAAFLEWSPFWLGIVLSLSILEIACFIYFKNQPRSAS